MPDLSSLVPSWEGYQPFQDTINEVIRGRSVEVLGLSGSSPSFFAASLISHAEQALGHPIPLLLVVSGMREVERIASEIRQYLPSRKIMALPPRAHIVGTVAAASRDWEFMRLEALTGLQQEAGGVVVAPAEAVRQRMAPLPRELSITVEPGRVLAPGALAERLVSIGYERETEVSLPGQFAWRGGVMDVFSPGQDPIRLEWFDDEIDSVRTFSIENQRSIESRQRVGIGPARELLLDDSARARGISRISAEAKELVRNLRAMGQPERAIKAEARYEEVLSALAEKRTLPGLDRFQSAFYRLQPLTAFFGRPPLVAYIDSPRVAEAFRGRDLEEQESFRSWTERGELILTETEISYDEGVVYQELKAHALAEVSLDLMAHGHSRRGDRSLALVGRPAPKIHGQDDLLQSELNHLKKSRQRVVMVVRDSEAERLMTDRCLEADIVVGTGMPSPGGVGIVRGQLNQGFVLPELALVVFGESELSGREIRPSVPRKRYTQGGVNLKELSPGELVVHISHGIGRYLGIETLIIQDQHKDYLKVEYAAEDMLYVPVDQLNLLQKYVGVEGREPKLSRMGSGEWSKAKERVRRSVRDMADELVRLYAIRESRPGFAFPADTPWQADFEAAFPYEETRDQLTAIAEIKRDMEKSRPMDRLLCGDVGYGKTEVALRAAFKAIMAGKQVAVLVPTTLLAEQHYATAKTRMAGYPVSVEVISRFRSQGQQKEILSRLAKGQVDLLVGTHRLLSQDVKFQDLGLLVVDEEHRFGVAHKERIKAMKEHVDVLTLSATPIPRTLHMAMIGIRDMSLIETPPQDRLPVETLVAEFDQDLVREAIRREIDRGGQVFYVQNRIRAMDASAARLIEMFPDLRVAVVHGQMDANRIEDTMARFIDQEYDILLATNIIESGLDIPNANTLVVEDADQLGLAQLYQLRGRVGRSTRLAYAYFTFHRDKSLTLEAEKRLEAIREFTELGAGYQIALRDLEIRGGGSLLGAEQHGYVDAIGFDLYTQLLASAIRELKGELQTVRVEPQIDCGADAYLPDAYISDSRQKISVYKRMVAAQSLEMVEELGEELVDRFGTWPEPVVRLMETARIRVLASSLGISYVGREQSRLVMRSVPESPITGEALAALARRYSGRILPTVGKVPELAIRLETKMGQAGSVEETMATAVDVLTILKGAIPSEIEEKSG